MGFFHAAVALAAAVVTAGASDGSGRDVDIVPCVDTPAAWSPTTDLSQLVLSGHENQYSVFACRFPSPGGDVLPGKLAALTNCCEFAGVLAAAAPSAMYALTPVPPALIRAGYSGVATPAATQCSGFESLLHNQPYVWSAYPVWGTKPVAAGRVSNKTVSLCRARLSGPGEAWIEPGYTADGSTCTVFMPFASGEVREVAQPFETLYAPWCGE